MQGQFLLLFMILVTAGQLYSQNPEDKRVEVVSRSGGMIRSGESKPDTLTKFRTGIMVMEAMEGIVYRSNLRDFKEISVEVLNKDGKLLYQFKNELLRNVNYNLAVEKMPAGEYIVQFSTEDRLIVCNLQIRS